MRVSALFLDRVCWASFAAFSCRIFSASFSPWGGDGGVQGGMRDVAAAARFQGGLMDGDEFAGHAGARVPLCLSHDVSFRIFNQK